MLKTNYTFITENTRTENGKREMKYSWKKTTKYLLNECSDETRKEIEELIENDSDFRNTINKMKNVISFEQKPLDITDAEKKWEEIEAQILKTESRKIAKQEMYEKRYSKSDYGFLRYAAVIVFIIGAISFFNKENVAPEIPTIEYKTLSVDNGERRTIILYDGTTVNLDCGSELKYPTKFGNKREVFLKGEAYFQVAKDSKRPFIIHADKSSIQVLGTKFNVKTWNESNKDVVVTVVEGKVAFGNETDEITKKVLLTKNMQSSISLDGKISKPIIVDASSYSKWMHNEVYFSNASMDEIISQLERWYDLRFEVPKNIMQKKDLAVHINDTNINDILEMLSVITNSKVVRNGKNVKFSNVIK